MMCLADPCRSELVALDSGGRFRANLLQVEGEPSASSECRAGPRFYSRISLVVSTGFTRKALRSTTVRRVRLIAPFLPKIEKRVQPWQAKELLELHFPGLIQRAAHRYLVSHDWPANLWSSIGNGR